MDHQAKKRGRPLGSGKNDEPSLRQVAALLVREPSIKPTTAMKRVIHQRRNWPETEATLLRRFQVKWRNDGATFLADARRATEHKTPAKLREVFSAIDAFDQRFKRVILSPEIDAFTQKMAAFDRHIKNVVGSPAFLETVKRMTEFDRNLMDALRSPAFHDLVRKVETINHQLNGIAAGCIGGVPKSNHRW